MDFGDGEDGLMVECYKIGRVQCVMCKLLELAACSVV